MTNAVGVLRVLRDVTLQPGVDNEFVAISDTPAAFGELLALERVINGALVTVQVCVIESRPAVVGGSVRHRLRLRPIDEGAPHDTAMSHAAGPDSGDR